MGNKVNITDADINGLFSVPFSLLISREWSLNYLLVSALDESKVNGFGVPFERSGVMVYDLDSTTARKIMKHKQLLIDKETDFYIAFSNVQDVRLYFNARFRLEKLRKIIEPNFEEVEFEKTLLYAIERVTSQISA